MIKLNQPMMALNRLLLLASFSMIMLSCGTKKQNTEIINSKKIDTTGQSIPKNSNYTKDNVVKKIAFNNQLSIIFTKDEVGQLGDGNFEKNINVLFVEENKIIDKIEFSNQSILCDVELVNSALVNNQLVFGILDSCDGEDPDELKIIYWKNSKIIDEFEVPKYFDDDDEKEKILEKYSSDLTSNDAIVNKYATDLLNNIFQDR